MISLKYLVLVICLFMLLESDVDGNRLRRANPRDKQTKKPHPTKGYSSEGNKLTNSGFSYFMSFY